MTTKCEISLLTCFSDMELSRLMLRFSVWPALLSVRFVNRAITASELPTVSDKSIKPRNVGHSSPPGSHPADKRSLLIGNCPTSTCIPPSVKSVV